MDNLISTAAQFLPSMGQFGQWALYALAASGTASAALKFGTPLLQKAAALTKTDKDDKAVYIAAKIGAILGFLAMNPAVKEAVSKRKKRK